VCVRANVCIHIYNTYIQHRETSRGYVCKTLYPFHTPRILRHTRGFKWRRGMMGIPKNVCKCCTLYSLRSTKFPLWSRFPYRGKVPHTRLYNVLIKTAVVMCSCGASKGWSKTCWELPWFFPARRGIDGAKSYQKLLQRIRLSLLSTWVSCSIPPAWGISVLNYSTKIKCVWRDFGQTIGETGERAVDYINPETHHALP
jgi:hypothetical protein